MSSNQLGTTENIGNVPQLSPRGTDSSGLEVTNDSLTYVGGIEYQKLNAGNRILVYPPGSQINSEDLHQGDSHCDMFHQQASYNLTNQPFNRSTILGTGTGPMCSRFHFHPVLYPPHLYCPGPPNNSLTYRRHPLDPLLMIPTPDGRWEVYHTDDVHSSMLSVTAFMDLGNEFSTVPILPVYSSQQGQSGDKQEQFHPINITQPSHQYPSCSPILEEPDAEMLERMSDNEKASTVDEAVKNKESSQQSDEILVSTKIGNTKRSIKNTYIDEQRGNGDAGWSLEKCMDRFLSQGAKADDQEDKM
ncbi:unnamed protein product [Orchesella dallaii]|uniref:Uncharacterized protein n=1 Tax=Orchesella dallaii TaxID=48710 RepID=A0ABP1PN00_9HEXA